MLLNYSQPTLPFFSGWNVVAQIIAYVVVAFFLRSVCPPRTRTQRTPFLTLCFLLLLFALLRLLLPASLCIFLALEKPAMGAVSLLLYTLNGGGGKGRGGAGRGGAQGGDEGATAASANNGTGAGERLLARQDGAPARAGSFLEHQTRTERQLSTVADADNEAVAMATPQLDNNLRASSGAAAQVAAQLAPRDL